MKLGQSLNFVEILYSSVIELDLLLLNKAVQFKLVVLTLYCVSRITKTFANHLRLRLLLVRSGLWRVGTAPLPHRLTVGIKFEHTLQQHWIKLAWWLYRPKTTRRSLTGHLRGGNWICTSTAAKPLHCGYCWLFLRGNWFMEGDARCVLKPNLLCERKSTEGCGCLRRVCFHTALPTCTALFSASTSFAVLSKSVA